MIESNNARIVFSERLSTGIVVHFEDSVSAFFPAEFLYAQRDAQSNTVFSADEGGDHPPRREPIGDVPYWMGLTKTVDRADG